MESDTQSFFRADQSKNHPVCFIAFLDAFSIKNGNQNHKKFRTLRCVMCMLYTNLFYLHRSLCSQLNRIKQVFKADSTCTSRSTYLYFWPRLVNNLLVLVGHWSLVNLLVLLPQAGHLSNPGVDHRLDLVLAHQRQCHVRLRAEAHHPAGSSSGCRSKTILKIC